MKRGSSGLSLVIGVDKPIGMTSHDVVSKARSIFGEKRVGHAGTLDPFASGVLAILVGPAARLDDYLTSHDKEYIADIAFGLSTDTDDLTGETLSASTDAKALDRLLDPNMAQAELHKIVGDSMQLPPVYSAIKRGGKKACDEARKGNIIELDPRPITIHDAELIEIFEGHDYMTSNAHLGGAIARRSLEEMALGPEYLQTVIWRVRLSVSKGTYIRSIARDLGIAVGVPAHLSALRRVRSGDLPISLCVTLDQLERDGEKAALDPLKVLGMRLLFANGNIGKAAENGAQIPDTMVDGLEIFEMMPPSEMGQCGCLPSIRGSNRPLEDGEPFAIIIDNRLKAIYSYDSDKGALVPDCIFSIGVERE